MSLEIKPITLYDANVFIRKFHRHHTVARRHRFSVSVRDGERLCGVAIAGRPLSRMLDDGETLEVLRVCTDGTPNACSMLYGAVRRAANAMGYSRVITYTLPSEGGASLRAAGYVLLGETRGGSWSRASRVREDRAPIVPKLKWAGR